MAEVRKVLSGLMPRERNSEFSRDEPRSDLLSRRKTGFLDFRAIFAIRLSFSEGKSEESRVKRIKSAESIASVIWAWMEDSKSSSGFLRPAVSTKRKVSSIFTETLSRVVPSSRATIATFFFAKRLRRLDLPAFV